MPPLNMARLRNDAHHRLLLGTHDMGGANQLRGPTKLRARSGRRYLRNRLAAPHQRPGKSLEIRASFDGDGFAGEHGLIELNRSLDEAHVCGDHAAER